MRKVFAVTAALSLLRTGKPKVKVGILTCTLLASALLAGASGADAAGVVRTDPNGKHQPAATIEGHDSRLAKTVNCTGSKRLHTLADELTAATGVKIVCGKGKTDWQIRDLPITIYARKVPLGKLLSWIAEASHLAVVAEKDPNAAQKPIYLFRRTRQQEKDLHADDELPYAQADWCWNAMIAIANKPETTTDTKNESSRPLTTMAKILASLPADAKDKVFAGDLVLLDTKSSAQASLVKELIRATVKADPHHFKLKESDLDQTLLSIQLSNGVGTQIVFGLCPIVCSDRNQVVAFSRHAEISDSDVEGLDLPERTKTNRYSKDPEHDCAGTRRRFLSSPTDWDTPILQTKIHINLPKGKRSYADGLAAVAEASGFSVVCEDYYTPTMGAMDRYIVLPSDTTLGDALKKLTGCWFSVDEKNKLIIGLAQNWREHQLALVPEALVSDLVAKTNGPGAELDDVTWLTTLTTDQRSEWIGGNSNLDPTVDDFLDSEGFLMWRVYDSLTPRAKTLAKSSSGVSLAGLSAEQLRNDFLKLRKYHSEWGNSYESCRTAEKTNDEAAGQRMKVRSLADPTYLLSATMRIKAGQSSRDSTPAGSVIKSEGIASPPPHNYYLELEFAGDDGPCKISLWSPPEFPIYSAARKAELAKQRTESTNPPKTTAK